MRPLKGTPLSASCYRAKSLLPSYSTATPATMQVTSGCIITNDTAKAEPLVGAVSYNAILRGPDSKMTRREHVSLASSETVVPAHGHIEGGLWPNTDCSTKRSPAECLKAWLGNSTEFILTDPTGAAEGACHDGPRLRSARHSQIGKFPVSQSRVVSERPWCEIENRVRLIERACAWLSDRFQNIHRASPRLVLVFR